MKLLSLAGMLVLIVLLAACYVDWGGPSPSQIQSIAHEISRNWKCFGGIGLAMLAAVSNMQDGI